LETGVKSGAKTIPRGQEGKRQINANKSGRNGNTFQIRTLTTRNLHGEQNQGKKTKGEER